MQLTQQEMKVGSIGFIKHVLDEHMKKNSTVIKTILLTLQTSALICLELMQSLHFSTFDQQMLIFVTRILKQLCVKNFGRTHVLSEGR